MKLNTDNAQTMPVTDAVYGPRPKGPGKPERERRERSLIEALDPATVRTLERLHAKARRKR